MPLLKMAFDLKQESDVKEFIDKLGVEYRFGCYHEGKPEVCHLLGDYLEAIKKDFEKARKVYKTNCDHHSFGKSCYKFANYTFIGKGASKGSADREGAMKYFEKGCQLGEPDSCLHAGLMCISNSPGAGPKERPRDYKGGMAFLEKGCEGKNAFSCYYLSGLFLSGVAQAGLERDMTKARAYSETACDLGNMYACANLSQMYKKGDGVAKDETLSEKFKQRALEIQEQAKNEAKQLNFQEGNKPV
ncbi:hypothetical protein B566_EDAN002730 [Ephemera danica]|nr:hypothetical protein B566_EDAN002730 [Ephemera danica]